MSEQSLRSKIEAISQASVSFPLLQLLGRVEALEIMFKSQDKAVQNLMDTIADFNEKLNVEANIQQYELDLTGDGAKSARKQ